MNLEIFEFVKDGAIKLPPGFRFQPTDEEVVFQYLLRKTFSWPLPASIIPVLNVDCNNLLDPWDLPGDDEQDRYFFSNNKEVMKKFGRNGNNRNNNYRATQTGYWKPTGIDKQIFNNNSNASSRKKPIIGKRKTLVFYKGKPPHHGTRTQWIMHEYRLLFSRNDGIFNPNHQISPSGAIQIGHWVICHIFMKKSRRSKSRRRSKRSSTAGTVEKQRRDCEFSVERVDEHEYGRYIIEQQDSTSTSSSSSSSFGGGGNFVASSYSDDLSVVTAEDEQLSSNCNY